LLGDALGQDHDRDHDYRGHQYDYDAENQPDLPAGRGAD
jgi:hypothetical protein